MTIEALPEIGIDEEAKAKEKLGQLQEETQTRKRRNKESSKTYRKKKKEESEHNEICLREIKEENQRLQTEIMMLKNAIAEQRGSARICHTLTSKLPHESSSNNWSV